MLRVRKNGKRSRKKKGEKGKMGKVGESGKKRKNGDIVHNINICRVGEVKKWAKKEK